MDIRFKNIIISNFLSVTNPITLTYKSGLCVVQGFNRDKNSRNGVGKSAVVLDSIFWCLFGKTFRNVKSSEIANRKNGKASVRLVFSVGQDNYIVTRRIPTKLSLTKNGIDITKSVPETNADICEILGCNEIFARNVMFLDPTSRTFLSETPVNRQKFLESIFDLSILRDMLTEARADKNNLQKELDKVYIEKQEKIKSIEQLKAIRLKDIEKYNNRKTELENTIEELESEIINQKEVSGIEASQVHLDELIKDLNTVEKQLSLVKDKIKEVGQTATLLEKQLSKFNPSLKTCPTCGQDCDLQDHYDLVKKDFRKQEKRLKSLRTDRKELIEIEQSLSEQIREEEAKLSLFETDSEDSKEKLKLAKHDLSSLTLDVSSLDKEIESGKTQLEEFELKTNKVLHDFEVQTNVVELLGDSGIKARIIPQLTALFETHANGYLQEFGFPYSIHTSSNFDIEILFKKRKLSYESLSGGERRRIDIAVLLALQDLRSISTGFSSNVFVCDEFLDSSLDESGINSIVEVMRERAIERDQCIFFITHRENVDLEFDRNIYLEKKNAETVLIS